MYTNCIENFGTKLLLCPLQENVLGSVVLNEFHCASTVTLKICMIN